MKSNPLLKWLLIPLALVLLFVGIKLFSGDHTVKPAASGSSQLTPEEMKSLGIAGDTPRDTVATLVAQVKQLRNELQTSLNDSKNQKAENDRLRARESTVDQRIQSTLDGERGRLQQDRDQVTNDRQQTQSLLQDLQRRLDGLTGKGHGQDDLPVGLGLEEGDGKSFGGSQGSSPRGNSSAGTRWVEPDDAKPVAKNSGSAASTPSFPTSFGQAPKTPTTDTDNAADNTSGGATDTGKRGAARSVKPVYTVPANSTLMGSIAMTALIGRVPIDGTVNDPYPFKVLIGPDNLTANGIDIPDVAGAVVSGTASGDWTLSCVRGQIRSVTFVFNDGTVRTMPDNNRNQANGQTGGSTGSSGGTGSNGTTQGGLGWISDPYGVPCVSGERRSNAQQYLGSQALITAAGAGAASLIKSNNGSVAVVANNNGSLGTVGISGNEAMGRILAGGVQDMSQWVNKLYGQAFAAIYVPPAAKVAVHLEHPLNIDYDAKGRRVNHRIGGVHASDLD
ncbi:MULTISPECIES: TIGR03752 family integrating conjugative element protein [Burkholderiaceae]|uniref:TIGR03752 family integrating conjugative element protein n=1 Tax=Burkholderia cepacia TaxID=292 RepID=A0A8I1DKX4_BURCE|nr:MULTISPECIES: TIGR03752 family integrating conjugative element protein [Burkholderiaceae]MBB0025225.1 TIGR03752 family integrating conjugative element protein [Ralstonia pickettii]MBB0036013.1 TIGR03752 family integrating conjugative element protein [Ralstonia pickettii]MBB0098553.1 TIGR03752 family integrating conjugative element protein [Ralstonia pickettii]MBB0108388.1 TIGR03752 family integrating conjugative element protein [Ralstonia pickettii]MBB0129327.1 TIGR03752 family integrating 